VLLRCYVVVCWTVVVVVVGLIPLLFIVACRELSIPLVAFRSIERYSILPVLAFPAFVVDCWLLFVTVVVIPFVPLCCLVVVTLLLLIVSLHFHVVGLLHHFANVLALPLYVVRYRFVVFPLRRW
jgi:hypothetical protein